MAIEERELTERSAGGTVLACIDASAYANSVCDLAAWASRRLALPVELLHIVQRKDPVAERHDLSGAIGLGAKTNLLQELTELQEADAKLQVERGRALIAAGEKRLAEAVARQVVPLHRHGGIVETILEREETARVVVMGKRGASHEFATDHLGSKVERVVRASMRPVLVASRHAETPTHIVFAYDGSPAAERALERLQRSPLFAGLPIHIVMAGADTQKHRSALGAAAARLQGEREVTQTLQAGKPDAIIANLVQREPGALLVMGAYGHSPLRALIVGSTTTAMLRTVHVPVLLIR